MTDPGSIRAALSAIPDPLGLLESFFRDAPFGLQIYQADGHCLLVNDAFLKLFGSQPPPEYNVLHDDVAERSGVLGLIRRAFAGELVRVPPSWYDPRELEQVHITEGRRVAIEATFVPLRDAAARVTHVAVLFRDVTAERLAQQEAESQREFLSAVIEQVDDAVVVADASGKGVQVNRTARELGVVAEGRPFAWTEKPTLHQADGSAMPFDDRPLVRALRGEKAFARVAVQSAQGPRLFAAHATPVRGTDGQLRGAVLVGRDETESARREVRLAEAARSREQLIGVLGHDLRQPLAAIKAGAQVMLADAELPPQALRHASRILGAAERMGRMIRDVVDFARTRLGGGMPIARREVDLTSLVRVVLDEIQAVHPHAVLDVQADGELRGLWDPDRLAQVIGNLVENALTHGAKEQPIQLRLRGGAQSVSLEVANRGQPLSAEARANLFDPFRRGPGSHGLGLGLYIVDQICRALGGAVELTPGPEASETRFRVTLPRNPPEGGSAAT